MHPVLPSTARNAGTGTAPSVKSVAELLADGDLAIPPYQRPYRWTARHVRELFADIATAHLRKKTSCRLGTIVLHEDGATKNIVDGQQRTITLMLAVRALIQRGQRQKLEREDLRRHLEKLGGSMADLKFKNKDSKAGIQANFAEVSRLISRPDFSEDLIHFLLHQCKVVVVVLEKVTEAFQFFDSQNARGRDLEPHDLLKAFHLREFSAADESAKAAVVGRWEQAKPGALPSLFASRLYRIRKWMRGDSARGFGKNDTALFKGVNIEETSRFPYLEQVRITHHFVDHYHSHYERRIDGRGMAYPFQMNQVIINGRRFFEMINHYLEQDKLIHAEPALGGGSPLESLAGRIMATLNFYPYKGRKGDLHVRGMFDCLLACYIDKFGHAEISRAVEKIFIWAYSLRLLWKSVQIASVDNYVRDSNLFKLLNEAAGPADFFNHSLPGLDAAKSSHTDEIEALFREMRYLPIDINS